MVKFIIFLGIILETVQIRRRGQASPRAVASSQGGLYPLQVDRPRALDFICVVSGLEGILFSGPPQSTTLWGYLAPGQGIMNFT